MKLHHGFAVKFWASSSPLWAHFPSLHKERERVRGVITVLSAALAEVCKVPYLIGSGRMFQSLESQGWGLVHKVVGGLLKSCQTLLGAKSLGLA